MDKIGRNAPCPCGSGKKYKKCCLEKDEQEKIEQRKQLNAKEGADQAPETEKEEPVPPSARQRKNHTQPGFRGYMPPKKGAAFTERGRKSSNRTGE